MWVKSMVFDVKVLQKRIIESFLMALCVGSFIGLFLVQLTFCYPTGSQSRKGQLREILLY